MLDVVASENVSKWKSALSAEEIASFEQIAGSALSESGYELSGGRGARNRDTLPRLSLHELRVAVKTMLPLVLGISARLGVPALAMINRRYPGEWQTVSNCSASTPEA
jgi:hypothetical protein